MADKFRDYENPEHLADPCFESAGSVHDWRNHVGSRTKALWETFTPEQKAAIAADGNDDAGYENWD